ncbi:hypothetical protein OE88DRAFT_1651752 [Heliocybe sulcata]|uniref:Yeast cell wall synthesis Kre9/Knh1-like N-terminal domain-containing protein n=1 Tax=Heliocybe sulcata TaxID=5364 RepID=A0A5C3NDL8_9AGAM|nr:hypothetical protein OE88DRAFT_1651752 [Heliocybe sulcata]
MRSYTAVLLSLAASALAYQITSPNANSDWTSTGPNSVSWEKVSTDASNFTLLLTNTDRSVLADNNQVLVALVDGNAGSLAVPSPSNGFPVGGTFRLNFVKSTQEMSTIYAQSDEFNITQSTASTSGSSIASGASTGTASRTTMTASATSGSSTGTSSGAGGLNPATSDSSTSPTQSSAALPGAGVQTGLIGLIAMVGAFLA